MSNHIMVDIETLGNTPDAPILSIGAVEFYQGGLLREFYEECSISSLKGSGAKIDPDTIRWWLKQSDAPRLKIANAKGSHIEMLKGFADFVQKVNPDGVWGNGVGFDNVILTQSFKRAKIEQAWPFWADRCYRTMKSVFPDVTIKRVGDHHNALDDAKTQALHLIEISRLHGEFL